MHARPLDRSLLSEEDELPDSDSRVPNIGDIDVCTLNKLLYEVSPTHEKPSGHSWTFHTTRI